MWWTKERHVDNCWSYDKSKHFVQAETLQMAQIGMDGASVITHIKDNLPSPSPFEHLRFMQLVQI